MRKLFICIVIVLSMFLSSVIAFASDWRQFYQSTDGQLSASIDLDPSDMEVFSTKEYPSKIFWANTWVNISTHIGSAKMKMTFYFTNDMIMRESTFYYDENGNFKKEVRAEKTPESDDIYFAYSDPIYGKAYQYMVEYLSGIKVPVPMDKNYSVIVGGKNKSSITDIEDIPKLSIYLDGKDEINFITEKHIKYPTYSLIVYYRSKYDKNHHGVLYTQKMVYDSRNKIPMRYEFLSKPKKIEIIPDSNGSYAINEIKKFCIGNPAWVHRTKGGIPKNNMSMDSALYNF